MHEWHFFRAGGFDQVSLDRGTDFEHLSELDQKLWVALGCPVRGLHFDVGTLALIDSDGDGRIRASELLDAVKWALQQLSSPDELLAGSDALPLAALRRDSASGAAIAAAAERVLRELGRSEAGVIDLGSAEGATDLLASRPLNGDGIVTVESSDDPALRAMVQAIIDCGYGETDRSGAQGASADGAAAFRDAANTALAWQSRSSENSDTLLPLGEATQAAAQAVQAIKGKLDDYFARCRLCAFDPRAEAALNREEGAWLELAARDLSIAAEEIRGFPLARVRAQARLDLAEAINPAWSTELSCLREAAIVPILGQVGALTESDWSHLQARLAPFAEWQQAKPSAALASYDAQTLQEWLGEEAQQRLAALIEQDRAVGSAFDALSDLVRLIRYRRDLARLCRNFVNFHDFYESGEAAIFLCGTLYLDQRGCKLCLPVSDAGRHASLAALAGAYLAYCDCERKASGEKMQIVAAFTDGDSDNLMVGRNGVFYDRDGRDWDATIVKLVDNPISVRQAFWAPYKKLARFIEQQVAKRAAAADTAGEQKLQSTVVMVNAPAADKAGDAAPTKKIDVGTVAALGVALGSLGTAFGYFLKTIADVKAWQMPLLLLGIMLAISGPAMILAWLKLRQRNIAPILDANGWAVNARALLNVPFGASLTAVAALPAGSRRSSSDRFAPKSAAGPRMAGIAFLLWWLYAFLSDQGYIDAILGWF